MEIVENIKQRHLAKTHGDYILRFNHPESSKSVRLELLVEAKVTVRLPVMFLFSRHIFSFFFFYKERLNV